MREPVISGSRRTSHKGALAANSLPQPVRVLRARVDPVDADTLTRVVERWVTEGRKAVIGGHNMHSLYLLERTAATRTFYDFAAVTRADGMGVIALGRMLGAPLKRRHRITYIDWFPRLLALAEENGWRVFYLGGAPGVAERGLDGLAEWYPSLKYACRSGYFDTDPDSEDSKRVIDAICDFSPHLLFVGMGMPRQERWVGQEYDRLPNCLMFTCGGCIDLFAGAQPIQPRWMRELGLAWLYRLIRDPRRLWRRYLLEPLVLVPVVSVEMAKHLLFPRRPR